MAVYSAHYLGYPGGHYMNDFDPNRPNGDDGSYIYSTTRSSESGSSRHSRLYGLMDGDRRISHESKPRLSKDQQEILERHFQKQPKPSTSIKKDFSETLGIPLDKINNWFQNRRAKVKQEAKKSQTQSAWHHGPHIGQAQYHSDSHYDEPSYYHAHGVDAPTQTNMATGGLHISLPAEASEPLVGSNIDQFGSAFDGAHANFGQAIAEPTFSDSPEVFNSFFGLDDNSQTYTNHFNHHALVDFGKQFHPAFESLGSYPHPIQNMERYGASTSVSDLTQSSRDDGSLYLNMSYDDHGALLTSRSNSNGPSFMSAGLNAYTTSTPRDSIKEEARDEMERDVEQETAPIPHQLFALDASTDLPLRPAAGQNMVGMIGTEPSPRPLAKSHQTMCQPTSKSDEIKEEQSVPDNSGDSNASIATPAEPTDDTLLLKSPNNGLAARRRNRPAALNSGSMRSSSFTNLTSPTSPKHGAQDPQLRRIKSSGLINGRIQKSGLGSGQRSPISVNFPDGATSQKIPRQLSIQSLDAVAAEQTSTPMDSVPITPLSPMDTMPPPHSSYHQPGRPYSTIIESDMENMPADGTSAQTGTPAPVVSGWGHHVNHEQNVPNYASPPDTPMEFVPHHSFIPQQAAQFMPTAAPSMPQSAPAWQQAFPPQPVYPNVQYMLPYGHPQPMPMQHGLPMGPPQQHGQMVMVHPLPGQPMQRPGPSNEDATVAAMLAAQQQLFRRPSVPMLATTHSMPLLNTSAPMQYQQPQYFNGYPVQMQPQSSTHGPNLHGLSQPQPFIYPMQPQHPDYDAPPPQFYEHHPPAASPIGPYHPTARSGSIMSLPMSMSMSPAPAPGGPSTPSMSGLMLGSPMSNMSTAGGMSVLSTPTKASSPELLIHEYSPREPADPSRLPPKSRTTTPRTYSFHHAGLETFSASPPA